MRARVRNLFVAVLLPVAPAFSAEISDFTPSNHHRTAIDVRPTEVMLIPTEAVKPPLQTAVVRTTGGVDTTGWTLIAVVHGPDAGLIREGQRVRAFSVNSRRR